MFHLKKTLSKILILSIFPAYSSSLINIKVMVTAPPPCVINDNKPIEIDFGDTINITQVDGKNYRKKLNYSLHCSNDTPSLLKMMINGSSSSFDASLLKTTNSNLGIVFFNNGQKLSINHFINFKYNNNPEIEAAPLKNTEIEPSVGYFSSSATITVDYQ